MNNSKNQADGGARSNNEHPARSERFVLNNKRKSSRRRLSTGRSNIESNISGDETAESTRSGGRSLLSDSLLSGRNNDNIAKLSLPAFAADFDTDTPRHFGAQHERTKLRRSYSSGGESLDNGRPKLRRTYSSGGESLDDGGNNSRRGKKRESAGRRGSVSRSKSDLQLKSNNNNSIQARYARDDSDAKSGHSGRSFSTRSLDDVFSSIMAPTPKLTKEEEAWLGIESVLGDQVSVDTRDVLSKETSRALRKVSSHSQAAKLSAKFQQQKRNAKHRIQEENDIDNVSDAASVDSHDLVMKEMAGDTLSRNASRSSSNNKNEKKSDETRAPASMPTLMDASFSSLLSDATDPKSILSFISSSQAASSRRSISSTQGARLTNTENRLENPLQDFLSNMTLALQQKQVAGPRSFDPTNPNARIQDISTWKIMQQQRQQQRGKPTKINKVSEPRFKNRKSQQHINGNPQNLRRPSQPQASDHLPLRRPPQEQKRDNVLVERPPHRQASGKDPQPPTHVSNNVPLRRPSQPPPQNVDNEPLQRPSQPRNTTPLRRPSQTQQAQPTKQQWATPAWTASSDKELPNGVVVMVDKTKKAGMVKKKLQPHDNTPKRREHAEDVGRFSTPKRTKSAEGADHATNSSTPKRRLGAEDAGRSCTPKRRGSAKGAARITSSGNPQRKVRTECADRSSSTPKRRGSAKDAAHTTSGSKPQRKERSERTDRSSSTPKQRGSTTDEGPREPSSSKGVVSMVNRLKRRNSMKRRNSLPRTMADKQINTNGGATASSSTNNKSLASLPRSSYFGSEQRSVVESDSLNNSMPSLATFENSEMERVKALSRSFGDLASMSDDFGTQFEPSIQAAESVASPRSKTKKAVVTMRQTAPQAPPLQLSTAAKQNQQEPNRRKLFSKERSKRTTADALADSGRSDIRKKKSSQHLPLSSPQPSPVVSSESNCKSAQSKTPSKRRARTPPNRLKTPSKSKSLRAMSSVPNDSLKRDDASPGERFEAAFSGAAPSFPAPKNRTTQTSTPNESKRSTAEADAADFDHFFPKKTPDEKESLSKESAIVFPGQHGPETGSGTITRLREMWNGGFRRRGSGSFRRRGSGSFRRRGSGSFRQRWSGAGGTRSEAEFFPDAFEH